MYFEAYKKLKKLIKDGYKVVFFTNQVSLFLHAILKMTVYSTWGPGSKQVAGLTL
jgi:hypothetical protein